jgi:hypothetical protein
VTRGVVWKEREREKGICSTTRYILSRPAGNMAFTKKQVVTTLSVVV